jgi:hypothetical protein
MQKTNILWFILKTIFLIIFNVFFFVIGGIERANANVWMSYIFIHLAYMMLIVTPMLIRKGKSSAVFGFALYKIASGYFFIQFIVGTIIIYIAPESINFPLVIQLSLAGLYAVMLIANLIANEKTAEAEEQREVELMYVKRASSQLESLIGSVSDEEAKKQVKKAYDVVSASQIKSHPNVASIEMNILELINDLESAVYGGETEKVTSLAKSLLIETNKRNRELQLCR